ncbi:MAG: M4 family metallopeptidase [Flexilinea sp.]|nr:M4 family metallopeptidase [Flexilinea sp.]
MINRRSLFLIFVLLAAFLLIPCSVSAQEEDLYEDETETEEIDEYLMPDEETLLSWPFSDDVGEISYSYTSSLDPDGVVWYEDEAGHVSFVSGNEFGTTVTDRDDAYSLAHEFLSDSDIFELLELRVDSFGEINVYSYQQIYDGNLLSGCFLKIITNGQGDVLGFASSLVDDPDDAGWDYSGSPEPANWEERFAEWDSSSYEKTVTAVSDEVVDVSIPVMIDPDTGERYLGDKHRLIFCVDLADLEGLDDRQDSTPINMDRNLYSDGELLTYYRFVQVYDFFAENGWWGPDGERKPCMLLFDTSGENNGNAGYALFQDGFHIFSFGVDDGAGQSLQVIAHEFTHGVSSTNHVGSYQNETGALDEALSDLIGNAVEADIRQWSPSENVWLYSFRRAHKYGHGLYVWDEFYTPPADYPDDYNDYGDVHHNANLISILAWRMYEAGMTPRDVFDFWFTFDLTLTPKTNFTEAAVKAPWIAEIAGLSEYAPVIQQAVEELRLADKSLPDELPEHQGMIVFDNPLETNAVLAVFYEPWRETEFTTWPAEGTDTIAAVLEEGTFSMISVRIPGDDSLAIWNKGENRWDMIDSERLAELYGSYDSDYCVPVDGGTITELGN